MKTVDVSYFYLVIAIFAEVIGTTMLKASHEFTRLIPSLIVIVSYIIAFYALTLSFRTLPISVAYAIWCGLGIVLITIFGWIMYGEKLDTAALVGISMIAIGTIVINLFSKATAHS